MKYLLLDRDGTVIVDTGLNDRPEKIELLPNAAEGLGKFRDAGYQFFIVTNQGGIAAEIYSEEDYQAVQSKIMELLEKERISIQSSRHCPHSREGGCECRKPALGMWESLMGEFPHLEPSNCLMVGDKDSDILFGRNIGCQTARIDSGQYPLEESADYLVKDLSQLANEVLSAA